MSDRRQQILDATIAVIARRGVRGLRVQEVAAEAGVSVTLLYHYFGNRSGLLEHALGAVSDQAERYSLDISRAAASAREELVARLVGELQDNDEVVTNSRAWGELRWASVFDESLRPSVQRLTDEWVGDIATIIDRVREVDHSGVVVTPSREAAERLVALVEGLSGRWLTGAVPITHLQDLLRRAVDLEVPPA